MRKKLISIFLISICVLHLSVTYVFAALDANVEIKSDKQILRKENEVTIILSVKDITESEDGIGGFETQLNYDKEIFEQIEQSDISSSFTIEYVPESEFLNIMSVEPIEENTDILFIKLKVKESPKIGQTSIEFTKSKIYNLIEESEITVSPLGIGITDVVDLTKIEITKQPTKTTYSAGEKFDKTGMQVTATYSDDSTNQVTDYMVSPLGGLTVNDKSVTISYKEGDITKTVSQNITVNNLETDDSTAAKGSDSDILTQKDYSESAKGGTAKTEEPPEGLPKAGIETKVYIGGTTILVIIMVISFVKMKRLAGI